MKELVFLYVEQNQIIDVSVISELKNLIELDLFANQVRDISALSDLKKLKLLDITGNPLNPDAYNIHIPRIIANNPGIDLRH